MDDKNKTTNRFASEIVTLRAENSQLKSLVENSSDILYRMSLPDGRYEYVSPASRTMLGYTPEEFYNTPVFLKKIIHPDWLQKFKEQWKRTTTEKRPSIYEYPVISKSGAVKWLCQKHILICDDNGKPVATEGIISDITIRKEIEEALKTSESRLLEAQQMARIGHWHWDVKTGDVEWSREVFNIFRLDPDRFKPQIDSILSLSPWPEDHKRNEELIEKAIKSREQGSYEQKFLLPDGGNGFYFSTFQGVYDDTGELVAIRGTVQDITERKHEQEEKALLEEKIRQAQKVESIGRLAGGVAHDLNNLLGPILGYGEMLAGDYAPKEKRKGMAEQIVKSALGAKKLVGQLLAFSRKQTLQYTIADINGIVEGVDKLLRRTIRENIDIKHHLSSRPQIIQADRGQIKQIILNLAGNAQDAMPDGGTLVIETADDPMDHDYMEQHYGRRDFDGRTGRYVMLTVRDDGCGMDGETLKHVFEPFFSTKGNIGAGLGLATVYGIAKQHGGDVFIESEPGTGTTVRVLLPCFEGDVDKKDKCEDRNKEAIRGPDAILVVEDNDALRRLIVEILQEKGYVVLAAADGAQALTILENNEVSVQLLLTDVVMPGMDGKQLLAEAVKRRPGLKVLYMSGYTDNVMAHPGIPGDAADFIQKPFSMTSLTQKVRAVLDAG